MKNIIFLICFFFLAMSLSFGQINRTGSFVADQPTVYPISGDVTVSLNNGVLVVDFASNFATIQGLVLEVFLGKTNTLNTNTDILISQTPLDAGSATFTPINGPFQFTVPSGINLYEYDNILVQCTSINMLWGHANLCERDLDLATSTLPSDTYRAQQQIMSSAILDNSATVIFETANSINLESGFEAPLTTDFSTILGSGLGCVVE